MRGDSSRGRCEVLLSRDTLYVANTGEPFTIDGVIALMGTHDSVKRDDKIGRFGLGFKSLLAVTDSPGSSAAPGPSLSTERRPSRPRRGLVPGLDHYPVMRLATAVDPTDVSRNDPILTTFMKWATTVIVAPLKRNRDVLARGLVSFPAEFLLFSQQVEQVGLEEPSVRRGAGDHAFA